MRQVKASARALGALVAVLAVGELRCTSEPQSPDAGPVVTTPDAGPEETPDAGPRVRVGYLEACTSNDDCQSGFCLPSKKCSKACARRDECPSGNGWDCSSLGGSLMCSCVPSSAGEVCDGFDNNCDGTVDEGARCEGAGICQGGKCNCPADSLCATDCVDKKTDVRHCGSCEKSCGSNEICSNGLCQCPGKVCGGNCIDTQYDSQNCGDCGKACAAGQECVDSSCKAIDREWGWWQVRDVTNFVTEGGSVRDRTTGLLWSAGSTDTFDHATAAAYCDGLVFDDYDDWRLPTRIELLSIVAYDRASPAMDPGPFADAIAGAVWSSTADVGSPDKAWAVNFQDGTTTAFTAAAPFFARCVR